MPSTPGTVSALIVNYHTYDELVACIAALEIQSPEAPLEVLVVDHETRPDRVEQVRRLCPRATIIPIAGNHGFASGVNRAAAQARGEYLLLVNPDTICDPASVATLKEWLQTHPEFAVAGPRILNEDRSLQPSARRFPDATTAVAGRTAFLTRVLPANSLTRRNLSSSFGDEPRAVDWVTGACALVRADAFHEVGGMDEKFFLYWEDADLCRRLLDRKWRTAYVPSASVVHVGGRASRYARLRALLAFHCSAYRYYRKHGGAATTLAAPLVWSGLWIRAGLKASTLLRRRS